MDGMIDIEATGDQQLVELARLLHAHNVPTSGPFPAPPSQRRRRVFPIARSAARAAAGTGSDAFNLKIIRETASACSTADNPDLPGMVAETLAGLQDIGPTNAREAMLAAQLLATHAAAMDSFALARAASGPLSDAHLGHAARLAHAHAALSDALDRMRRRDRQTVVFEYRHSPETR